MQPLLLAAYKPPFISSNAYLKQLKRQFHSSKGGYLGTLDPFAQGVLVVGFGAYTKLFPHLPKSPKRYRATLWLGAQSKSLDIENIQAIHQAPPVRLESLYEVAQSLQGVITYTPPHFSAKHIHGRRAYQLARSGRDFILPPSTMEVFACKILHYIHPFVSFEVSISEGGYVRSIGKMIAERLSQPYGALSSLERLSEGEMSVTQAKGIEILDPLELLPYPRLQNMQPYKIDMQNGKKIHFKNTQKGRYIVCFDDFFSIIEIFCDGRMEYLLNRMEYAHTL